MTLSRRTLLQRSLLASPVMSGNILFTSGGIAALAEAAAHSQSAASSVAGAPTASTITVRAGESRAGKPWNINGAPHVWNKIAGTDVGGRFTVLEVTTPAGEGPPLHIHEIQNEWMFLLAGSFGIQYGSERAVIHRGDCFMVSAGVPHAYIVLGTEPARHLNLYDPAGEVEAFFENFDQDHQAKDRDPALAAARGRKYRTKVVGPSLKASSFAT
jgi:mannose-6-phosphate isomerase-like protein (cupin superfamily)